ncbi:phage tail protein, partial [Xenorhabdus sp. 18]|nr:phage tail protein [Xenorhabdus sp. 18]
MLINKPDYKIFANDAKTGEIETFPDILRGWGVTIDRTAGKPPMEWFNAIGKRADEWMMYLTQRGIVEWDAAVDYPQYAVVQHGSKFYTAKRQTQGQQPDKSQNEWMLFADAIGIAKSVTDALNDRLEKSQNGADILNPAEFVKNLGLLDVVR